jgi:hypothetical protein
VMVRSNVTSSNERTPGSFSCFAKMFGICACRKTSIF